MAQPPKQYAIYNKSREDRTGSERLWYDAFGNVRKTLRRIIVPGETRAFQFRTDYLYDSFGRIWQITYPDGENVYYTYYTGMGNLYSVIGSAICEKNISHDELGHVIHKDYLNGCHTDYLYDADRQWLTHHIAKSDDGGNTIFQDLLYSYDAVGNIVHVRQHESQWYSMGGTYDDYYFYDTRYRLAQNLHDDIYTGITHYNMAYSPTTRIGTKFSDNPDLGHPDLAYGYDNSGLTHQPRVVHDYSSQQHLQLYWDANGNLRQIQPYLGYTRFHFWDDDNQLLMSVGSSTCGYYGNASDGKRAYKITGTFSLSNINGGVVYGDAMFDYTTLYPNPYMTLTPEGYTKHYFAGAERIGTTLGGGNNGNWLVNPLDNLTQDEYNRMMVLKDSYLYQHYYYDCYDYPHSNSNTENTNLKGTVEYGDAVVSLTLSNPMSAKSFLKLPLLGYTDYWKSNISPAIDHVFNSEANITGFMHTVNMTMTWTTTIKKVQ